MDLERRNQEVRAELEAAFARVLASGRYILGDELEGFEREFARFCGVEHCVGVGSGLDALQLGLEALGIGAGDEVLVPAHTFIATWLAVSRAGAIPVPVEVDEHTGAIDLGSALGRLSARVKAVIVVHLYGMPVAMRAWRELCRARGLWLIEDAAQAHGASAEGQRAGSWGDLAAFSFYPAKNLGALGDGGAIVTRHAEVAEKVRRLRNYGAARKYEHQHPGCNSRLDELQAAFLRVFLKKLVIWNGRRATVAKWYASGLKNVGVRILSPPPGVSPAWHLFPLRTCKRDATVAALEQEGIEAGIHYPKTPYQSGAYRSLGWSDGAFPVAERWCKEVLTLPMHPWLTRDEVDRVCKVVSDVVGSEG